MKTAQKKKSTTVVKAVTLVGKKAGIDSQKSIHHPVTDYLDFTYPTMLPADRLKFDVGNIYENKIQCKKCGWVIRSKNRHNFVTCKCGAVSVDGGSWYQRVIGKQDGFINHTTFFKKKHA